MSNIAIVEYQTSGGAWVKVSECQNRPQIIKQLFDAAFRSNPSYTKLRAIDAATKQILDMAFR
jgi:hypothetical protein